MLANARAVSEPYRVHAHQQARDLVSFERASTPPLNSLFVPKRLWPREERPKTFNISPERQQNTDKYLSNTKLDHA